MDDRTASPGADLSWDLVCGPFLKRNIHAHLLQVDGPKSQDKRTIKRQKRSLSSASECLVVCFEMVYEVMVLVKKTT